MKRFLFIFIILTTSLFAEKGRYYNLDFENYLTDSKQPELWEITTKSGDVSIDQNQNMSLTGNSALRINNSENGKTEVSLNLELEKFRNSRLRAEVFVKSEDFSGDAYLKLFAKSLKISGVIYSDSVKSSTDWKKIVLDGFISEDVNDITLSCIVNGEGSVWFDSFVFIHDGQPYIETIPIYPNPAEIDLLSNIAIKIDENNSNKYSFIDKYIENKDLIALGQSDNTEIIQDISYDLTLYITEYHKFTKIAMNITQKEANSLNNLINSKDMIVANDPLTVFLKSLQEKAISGNRIEIVGYRTPRISTSISFLKNYFKDFEVLLMRLITDYEKYYHEHKSAKSNNNKVLTDSLNLKLALNAKNIHEMVRYNDKIYIKNSSEKEYMKAKKAAKALLDRTSVIISEDDTEIQNKENSISIKNISILANEHKRLIVFAPNHLIIKSYLSRNLPNNIDFYSMNITSKNVNLPNEKEEYFLENHLNRIDNPFYFIDLDDENIDFWASRYFYIKSFKTNKKFFIDGELKKMFDGLIYYRGG